MPTARKIIFAASLCFLAARSPAAAAFDPLNQGPLADFLNLFSQQAVPRQVVPWTRAYSPGTVVISTSQRRLYYVLGNGQAIQYGVGVGRQGFTWSGTKTVSMKREWPDWRPPQQMLKRRPDLPRYMRGGIENPLGARAIYLGSSLYRIHGSNEPETIGAAVSSGGGTGATIRMGSALTWATALARSFSAGAACRWASITFEARFNRRAFAAFRAASTFARARRSSSS
jgi:hypothetical protein